MTVQDYQLMNSANHLLTMLSMQRLANHSGHAFSLAWQMWLLFSSRQLALIISANGLCFVFQLKREANWEGY